MKRTTIMGVILILLLSSLSFSTMGEDNKSIIIVDDDGDADYTSIQDAIDNASDGDTVYVYSGTYYENLDISKSITLTGESKENTIIKNNGVVNYSAEIPWKTNFTGTVICQSSIMIQGFRFDDFLIELVGSNNMITDNIFNSSSLYVYGFNCTVFNNKIINNTDDFGLIVIEARARILANVFDNNKYGLLVYRDGHLISENIFSENEYGFVFYSTSGLLWYENSSGNVEITGNLFIDNTCGLYVFRHLVLLASWSHINYNNFIGNTQHAYFLVNIHPGVVMSNKPFPIIKTERTDTRWKNNYWDDHKGIGPRMITGKIGILFLPTTDGGFISPIIIPFYGGCPYFNFDWRPASEPYDIPRGGNI